MNSNLESLIYNSDEVPTLPIVYQKIKEAVENPESSFEDIARIVCNDQGLSARLLRLANSAFYGYPSTVSTVPDALTVIGLQQFKNMALSTCIMDVFKGVPSTLVNMRDFWRKSIACGLCARIMALELREANSERFFLGGLMHKVGRLILIQQLPDETVEILQRSRDEKAHVHTIEREVLGFDHCEVGSALLDFWKLPSSFCDLVRYYTKPVLSTTSVQDASLIHLSDFLTDSLRLGNAGDQFAPEFSDAAWGFAGLDESRLYFVVEELQRQFEEVCNVFLKPT